jgi:hypothetical protein
MALPKYMEARPMKRGGTSYRVRLPDGRKVSLGRHLEEALARYAKIMPTDQQDGPSLAGELWARAKKGAAARSIPFDLSEQDVASLVERAGGRCELTRRTFTNEKRPGARIRPWAASIDRRDAEQGYTFGNCRLVCAYVNVALNRFGDALFVELVEAIVRRTVREELASNFPRPARSPVRMGNAAATTKPH